MEDITPLFIYISSCDKYYRENGHGKIEWIYIYLFLYEEFRDFGYSLEVGDIADYLKEHRISVFKRRKKEFFYMVGCCDRYTQPFMILFKGYFRHFRTEEERLEYEREIREAEEAFYSDSDDNDDEEKEELPIDDSKTFKLEQCVICLEKEPKVLFCNCGHIYICKECLVKKLDNCPVCKKENTILRIIE